MESFYRTLKGIDTTLVCTALRSCDNGGGAVVELCGGDNDAHAK
jgi:hypothetical protein